MKIMIEIEDETTMVDVKDVYSEIQKFVTLAATKGKREIKIWFMDDSFQFNHVKPIVDKLSKLFAMAIHAEGSSLIRTHIYIAW
jgi:hypothetical protein